MRSMRIRSENEGLLLRTGAMAVGIGAIVLLALGCTHTPMLRDHVKPPASAVDGQPNIPALVHYLNSNAKKTESLRCRVEIDAKQGKFAIGVGGLMACRKPRDFRIKANAVGSPAADLGSNDEEFWCWVSKAPERAVFYGSHSDMASGKVKMPFPFQPELVLAALGMADYDANGKYELRSHPKTMELVQTIATPNGQTVRRITVFDRQAVQAPNPQIIGHVLVDEKGKMICEATVQQVHVDRGTGAVIPKVVTFKWPSQEITMKLMLSDIKLNQIDQATAAALFTRADLKNIDTINLATGQLTRAGSERAERMPPRR